MQIHQADLFGLDLTNDLTWQAERPVAGRRQPALGHQRRAGATGGSVRPPKRRIDGLDGFAALTGASNFDVAEAVWLKLIASWPSKHRRSRSCARRRSRAASSSGRTGAAADRNGLDPPARRGTLVRRGGRCLPFPGRIGAARAICARFPSMRIWRSAQPESVMGFARGWLIADRRGLRGVGVRRRRLPADLASGAEARRRRGDGAHDVSPKPGGSANRAGEILDVEREFVYPLIKGGDLARDAAASPERAVLVTQQRIGEDTGPLAELAPRLWSYLQTHSASFTKRRSSIYRGGPPFAMFGIGPYSFAPFKVATGGLHKEPRFRRSGPERGNPSCSMTRATSSPALRPRRPRCWPPCATTRSPWRFLLRQLQERQAPDHQGPCCSASICRRSSSGPIAVRSRARARDIQRQNWELVRPVRSGARSTVSNRQSS